VISKFLDMVNRTHYA